MTGWQIIGIILGSNVLVALVDLVLDRLKRKDTVKDRSDDTADQIEELRTDTSKRLEQMDGRIGALGEKIDTVASNTVLVMESSKAQAYDRIRHLGMTYIKAGKIGEDELRNLMEMHQAYQALGGDGFLDRVMLEVGKLRIEP